MKQSSTSYYISPTDLGVEVLQSVRRLYRSLSVHSDSNFLTNNYLIQLGTVYIKLNGPGQGSSSQNEKVFLKLSVT